MKYLLTAVILFVLLNSAGCISENKSTAVTVTPTSQIQLNPSSTIPLVTTITVPTQTYKNADLVLSLNTNPSYGFKMDYPSDWTYKKEHTKSWSAGYNFSSPDEKSNVYVYIDDIAGSGYYFYPLDTITPTSLDKTSWANNEIKNHMITYCLDGSGKQHYCSEGVSGYHMRLVENESVILSGNIRARKLVFAPDIKDPLSNWKIGYIMHVGKIQGYNFTIPDHFEVAVKVDGPVWDYGMGGQAYAFWISTPQDQVEKNSETFDHMVKSFEVTTK